jgi:formylglycine-generating enzyme required for sulfatase activity/predicted phosphodiesterase
MSVTWLHISDFHIQDGDSYDRDVVLRALVRSAKIFCSRGHVPDLIFATGDIAHSGKPRQYDLATDFFDQLLAATGLDRRYLFVTPGNHDVDRDLGYGLSRSLESREEADKYFGPDIPKPHLTQKLRAFLRWHNSYFEGIRTLSEQTTCGPAETVNVRGFRVGILPINTALFCQDDSDHAQLWVGRRCLDAAVQNLNALSADVKIALMHHPIEWLHGLERPNIRATFQSNFDLILRGHLHDPDVEAVASASGEALHCAAGAAYQTRKWPNRAAYASIQGESLTVFPIRYEDEPNEIWTVDPSLFPNEPEHQKSFSVPGLRKQSRSVSSSPKRINTDSDANDPGAAREPEFRSVTLDKSPEPPSNTGTHAGPQQTVRRTRFVVLAVLLLVVVVIMIARWPSHKTPILESRAPQPGYAWLSPGQFRMGCSVDDSSCFRDEFPQHSVKLSTGFYMMRTEVTLDDFRAYAEATGAAIPDLKVAEKFPVANITWDEANAYCGWAGGRLPTEAEWEYAARAGSGQRFYGQLDAIAWYQGNTNSSRAVGQKQRNAFGLYDMLGNISEWVGDRYDEKYYQSSPPDNPMGGTGGEERVVRGGSYLDGPDSLRVSRRESRAPSAKGGQVGFRCVKDPEPSGR